MFGLSLFAALFFLIAGLSLSLAMLARVRSRSGIGISRTCRIDAVSGPRFASTAPTVAALPSASR